MGICCSDQKTISLDLSKSSSRKNIQLIDEAYLASFIRSQDKESIRFSFWPNETVKGTKNNGWKCDAVSLLSNGCQKGFNKANQTQNEYGFFDLSSDFVLCEQCAKAAQDSKNLIQWNAYISEDGIKSAFDLQYFILIRNVVNGAGTYQNANFTIQGAFDFTTREITLNKVNQGEEQQISFKGKLDEYLASIRSKYIRRDGAVFQLKLSRNMLKMRKKEQNFDLLYGSLKLSAHNCLLVGPKLDTQWICDGGRSLFKKCIGGTIDNSHQNGKIRYRCDEHNFDLCLECAQYVYMYDQLSNRIQQKWTGFWIQDSKKSEMTFDVLHFAQEKIYGKGEDEQGIFFISGKYNHSNGELKFRKKYLVKSIVTYKGVISNEGKIVKGIWKIKGENEGELEVNGVFELNRN
ncbi:UNKNOWN [Stylonychia lemnae]|uniref:Uncharacterized protein n=1 Tax=Stylonychia lemnae TaxID=5949 RepID=A0A078BAC6_STYLE|nr:UNKNOWN [Stylonychia lemnae]|eukprot:CDW91510.1 UNKNOWN [Stylonychia lemnae]